VAALVTAPVAPAPATQTAPAANPARIELPAVPQEEWGSCVEVESWQGRDWSPDRPGAQRLGDLPPVELTRAVLREIDGCRSASQTRP
jgi:hypothetical protein